MLNIFLFLAGAFLFTFLFGREIERIKVPWIFAALFLGFLLAMYNPFSEITSSSEFQFLANLGMYFLLFVIGFELDLKKLKEQGRFIFKATFFIILFEAFFGTLVVHFVFGVDWMVAIVVALSFATVGEAILIPILDEFKIVNTKLGQTIIGIGTLDDIIEIIALLLMIFLVDTTFSISYVEMDYTLFGMVLLFFLAYGLTKIGKGARRFLFTNIETLFLFVVFIFFLFLGVGEYADAMAVAAILAGISIKTFVPAERLKFIESEIKTMCYGFFAPIFFLWVGMTMDVSYLFMSPLLVVLVVAVSKGTKLFASWLIGKKELGSKKSILLGLGLSVRFSTSIIIIKILFENNLVGIGLYSVIIASSIVFKFIIPPLFSNLLSKWAISRHKI